MANAFADQLKNLGLRHGEKAGVAIASTIFLVCVGMAATTKTIELTPDQIKKAAQDSDKNLSRHGGTRDHSQDPGREGNQGQQFRRRGRGAGQDGAGTPTITSPPASGSHPNRERA